MARSVYLTAIEPGSGKSVVALGMMESWPVTTSSDLLAEGDCSGAGGSGMVRT